MVLFPQGRGAPIQGGIMRYLSILLCLLLLAACNTSGKSDDTSFNSVEDVRDERIPLMFDVANMSIEKDRNKTTTSFTTLSSSQEVRTYFQDTFQNYGWERSVDSRFHDGPRTDLRFEKRGQDGDQAGDRFLSRFITISIHSCGVQTCVSVVDSSWLSVISEGFY
jgi:hypothetical protein